MRRYACCDHRHEAIRDAVGAIRPRVTGGEFDRETRDAAPYNLVVIGEAAGRCPPSHAQLAADLLMAVHRQLFRAARAAAVAGRSGPSAVKRLRAHIDKAYRLLEHGLGDLGRAAPA